MILKELKDFLSSYCPRLREDKLYCQILSICEDLARVQDITGLKESICIFIIHQFRQDMEFTQKLITDFDLGISEKQLQNCLFQPFSLKSLKDDNQYLILKIRDYSMHTLSNEKFVALHLEDDKKKNEFINRCFFSNIEKLVVKLDDMDARYKNLLYLVIMKVSYFFV